MVAWKVWKSFYDYLIHIHDLVEYREDHNASGGMYIKFGADVLAVSGHGMERKAEPVGNLFVRQSVCHQADDVSLPVAQCVGACRRRCVVRPHGVLLAVCKYAYLIFQFLHGGYEQAVLYLAVRGEVFSACDDVEQGLVQHIGVGEGIMPQEYLFQLIEPGGHAVVSGGEIPYMESWIGNTFQQAVYVWKYESVFLCHMASYLFHIFIEELEDEKGHIVGFL